MDEDRKDLAIRLLAEGYTTKAVRWKMQEQHFEPYSDTELIIIRQQYAPDIADIREEEELEIFHRGLARRPERIRRLVMLAEMLEQRLTAPSAESKGGVPVPLFDHRVAAEFRRTIEEIGKQADPLGIGDLLDPEDPWVMIIGRLTKLGTAPRLPNSTSSSKLLESNSQTTKSEQLSLELERKSLQEENVEVSPSTQQ